MEWWTWILLWLALGALALIFLGFLAWRIFRGFTGVMDELGRASELLAPNHSPDPGPDSRPTVPAIFKNPGAVRADHFRAARLRQWQRLERRVRRRSLRGQPQRLRDLPHL